MNTVINGIQTTYKKYGKTGTANTVTAGAFITATNMNIAIDKLNACINNSSNRRFYYYKGGTIARMAVGNPLSASTINNLGSVNTQVSNDYCNCNSACNCDSDCCYYDCSCDNDCCDSDCCDNYGCDSDCCAHDCIDECGEASDDCSCDVDLCVDCCDSNCCDSDCCDFDCRCNSD